MYKLGSCVGNALHTEVLLHTTCILHAVNLVVLIKDNNGSHLIPVTCMHKGRPSETTEVGIIHKIIIHKFRIPNCHIYYKVPLYLFAMKISNLLEAFLFQRPVITPLSMLQFYSGLLCSQPNQWTCSVEAVTN